MTLARLALSASLSLLALACRESPSQPTTDAARDDLAPDHATPDDAPSPTDAPPFECREDLPDGGLAVSGHAMDFGVRGGVIPGALVTALELPGRCARTASNGAFRLEGFAPGGTATLVMYHPERPLIQTGTHVVSDRGLERVTFQSPDRGMFRVLELLVGVRPSPERCQLATTVTRVGASLYTSHPNHGEEGATVTLDPPVPPSQGPIYFDLYESGLIAPDRRLTQTTRDGGVLFLDLPPGDYVLTAHKPGVRFTQVRVRCRAGVLVNASPPWGLQAL